MTSPIQVDLPHKLGAAEAKRRIAGGTDKLRDFLPGGAEVRPAWDGDRLRLHVAVLGGEVDARIDVRETFVRVEVMLPPALGFFGKAIESALKRKGAEMLEDRSGERRG